MKITTYTHAAGGGKTTQCAALGKAWSDEGINWIYTSFMARNNAHLQAKLPKQEHQRARTLHSLAYQIAGMKSESRAHEEWIDAYFSEDDPMIGLWTAGRNRAGYLRTGRRPTSREAFDALPDYPRDKTDFTYFDEVVQQYEEEKMKCDQYDFTDVLFRAIEKGSPLSYQRVMLDEVEDYSQLLWEFTDLLVGPDAELKIYSGDLNQSIFGFTGADCAANARRLEKADEIITSPVSHRVPWPILDEAMAMLPPVPALQSGSPNSGLFSRDGGSNPPLQEGPNLLLFRNRGQMIEASRWLTKEGHLFSGGDSPLTSALSYSMSALMRGLDGAEISNSELLEVWALLKRCHPTGLDDGRKANCDRLQADPLGRGRLRGITIGFLRQLEKDPLLVLENRDTGKRFFRNEPEKLDFLRDQFGTRGVDLFRVPPRIHVSSVHRAKGGECETVLVCNQASMLSSDRYSMDPEEERRIKFVALTRATKQCVVYGARHDKATWKL